MIVDNTIVFIIFVFFNSLKAKLKSFFKRIEEHKYNDKNSMVVKLKEIRKIELNSYLHENVWKKIMLNMF